MGGPGTFPGCVPTSTSNGYFTPAVTPSSRDSSGSVRGNYSAGIPTPKESLPMQRFRRMEHSSTISEHGISYLPVLRPRAIPVFKRVGTLPPGLSPEGGGVRFRSEVASPVSTTNPTIFHTFTELETEVSTRPSLTGLNRIAFPSEDY